MDAGCYLSHMSRLGIGLLCVYWQKTLLDCRHHLIGAKANCLINKWNKLPSWKIGSLQVSVWDESCSSHCRTVFIILVTHTLLLLCYATQPKLMQSNTTVPQLILLSESQSTCTKMTIQTQHLS